MNTTQDKIAEIVGQVPELDKRGTFTGPTWEDAIKIFDAVLAGGDDAVRAIVNMLKDVDDGSDYKARYVLHGISHYLGRPEKEKAGKRFAKALASELEGNHPKGVKGFLCRQLQVVGGREVTSHLGALLADRDLFEDAAQALVAIRAGAAEQFRKALPELDGPPRRTVIQALGVLADGAAVEGLRKAATDENPETRLLAVWALARIGDAGAVDVAIKESDAEPSFVRIKATSNALLLAEKLLASGKKAEAVKIYKHLYESRQDDSEAYVKEAAQEGLAKAGG